MLKKINTDTLNHKFKIFRDVEGYEDYVSEPASKKEVEEARKDLKKNYKLMAIGRSCWECNDAHIHLIDMPAMNCFSCGKIYHRGIDVIDYKNSKYEKFSHLINKNEK